MSSDQNPGYLLYRGDCTTQVYGDCNKLLKESLLNNQYFMECQQGLVHVAHMVVILPGRCFRDLRPPKNFPAKLTREEITDTPWPGLRTKNTSRAKKT